MTSTPTFHPIAIVGRGCVLPGALDPQTLWDRLAQGDDLTSAVPPGRWGMPREAILTDDPQRAGDRSWSDRGGYVSGFDEVFDPSGFAVPAEALEGLDPLVLWVLHAAREALREAGDGVPSARTGLVMGNLSFPSEGMARFAERVWADRGGADVAERIDLPATDARNRFMSGWPMAFAAQALGLGEGGVALDAACASSLYALKLACDRLADGTADRMIAGAVNRSDDLFVHVGFCALQALSTSGRSRPFHAEADGLLPAEGCAVVALERLEDAVAAGRPILGVIRGIGLSNDGRGGGILAPSQAGQVRAIRQAWRTAGLSPTEVGWVECHATGTQVGDKVEIASMMDVFGDVDALPIGSIKGNMGHPITAAGAAGLLKVLGALAQGVYPPSRGAEVQTPALDGTPFQVRDAATPWTGPRRAGISAFGFGGNNAHVVVEAYTPDVTTPVVAEQPPSGVAVVSMGARTAAGPSVGALADALAAAPAGTSRIDRVSVALEGLRFPPHDLKQTLPQQLLVLEAVREAVAGLTLTPHRTGVFVGMGADPEVARYGARWRLAAWSDALGLDAGALMHARDRIVPVLTSAGVVGTMPNIPANRISSHLDAGGPGFTLSSEEASGMDALEVARRAVARGELDVAIVAAVDLSCEPVHRAALAAMGQADVAGDGAVALVLVREDEVAQVGGRVLAVLDDAAEPTLQLGDVGLSLTPRLGRPHAASGLLAVAAAVAAVSEGRRWGAGAAEPWTEGSRVAEAVVRPLLGRPRRVVVRCDGPPALLPRMATPPDGPMLLNLPAHGPEVALRVASPGHDDHGCVVLPVPPWLPPVLGADLVRAPANPPQPAAPAPAAPRTLVAPTPSSAPAPVAAHAAAVAPAARVPAPVASSAVVPPVVPAAAPPAAPQGGDVASLVAAEHRRLAEVHRAFLARQQAVHATFLQGRERALQAWMSGQPSVGAVPAARAPAPVPSTPATPPQTIAAPVARPVVAPPAPRPEPAPPPVVPTVAAPAAKTPAPSEEGLSPTLFVPADQLPGLKLDRAQLEVHSSGRISSIFGPVFTRQDGYARQVRMPEPPLLLADRMVGIEATPGVLGKGVIWTETDVGSQEWYLHHDRMPAGVMIEAGQADLMLISYMGIDFFNQSERVYRLLGCTLTYGERLPRKGDTLRYQIHMDGHAKHGDVRLMFFHYDCVDQTGARALSVRGGQAGFFTEAELADSDGVLWDAVTGEHLPDARVDAPAVVCTRSSFDASAIEAFAAGDAYTTFGPGFERAASHRDTPRIQPLPMRFFHHIDTLDPQGGPWGRGYLHARWKVSPDDWFFEGHFHNDPCMPGTLMFEGCLQALAFYMAALGYTLPRDGWRFEPVPDNPIDMRCRGQVLPDAGELIYEVFVEEVHAGPVPTVYADLLCTVDGRKAFHARRCGLRLVPDWPLERLHPEGTLVDPPGAEIAVVDGFRFDLRAMIACAYGKPSAAFGPMYDPFDGPRSVPRLPCPPYHFVSRTEMVDGPIGGMKVGTRIRTAYDIPPDAWYFDAFGAPTMPFAVLLEAALQPCGWLASYVGSALRSEEDLFFRNLDGTGTLRRELTPEDGTLLTDVTITRIAQSGGMIIVGFDVTCEVGDERVYDMTTVFGFFPAEALANQKGLPEEAGARDGLEAASNTDITLTHEPADWFGGSLRLGHSRMRTIDRIVGLWTAGGRHGQGRIRVEKDVDPRAWFFQAHFYNDPVQPGSLGIEAMIQGLQAWMMHAGLADGLTDPRFEPIALGDAMTWRYRGQVVPTNRTVVVVVDIVEVRREDGAVVALAEADLWCDGRRIYHADNLGMRIVQGPPVTERILQGPTLDVERDGWVGDHRPTFTVPALPMMTLVDGMAAAVAQVAGPASRVVRVEQAEVRRWVVVDPTVSLRHRVSLTSAPVYEVITEARTGAGDWDEVMRGRVRVATGYPDAPTPWPVPEGHGAADPYATGRLFHGPAFQLLTKLTMGDAGSHAVLDVGRNGVPVGVLNPGLLDAATHAVPHDALSGWSDAIDAAWAAYPLRLDRLVLHAPLQACVDGEVEVVARFDGMVGKRHPAVGIQITRAGTVLAELRLVEVLVPKGPIGSAPPEARRAFLAERDGTTGVGLSTPEGDTTRLRLADVAASDWLPGTVASVYGVPASDAAGLVARDHAARLLRVHPSRLTLEGGRAFVPERPLNAVAFAVSRQGADWVAEGAASLDLSPVEAYWEGVFGRSSWPVADVFYGLIARFVGHVHVADPAALTRLTGRPVLYLANHQTAVESLVFSIVVGGLSRMPTVTIAKAEHRHTWLGRLIAHAFSYPGTVDPGVITFFDREDKPDLQRIVGELTAEMAAGVRSVMVHVEGTRSLSCRESVQKMSGAFLDMALAVGAHVVPVKFTGGLPVAPLEARTEYPHGLGSQDIWLGAPLSPGMLSGLGYKERKACVVQAIHALGPSSDEEVPSPPDEAAQARVAAWQADRAVSAEHAVLWDVLTQADRPLSEETRRLVEAVRAGDAPTGTDAVDDWLRELATRLGG